MSEEFKLSYTASEVDANLGKASNAVLFTEQELTEEQKAQVRANIGAVSQEEKNSVITAIKYTYDGDQESLTDAVWVQNYLGNDLFFKVADLPEGKLNILGSSVYVTSTKDTYLSHSLEITEEELKETVVHSNGTVTCYAQEEGFTQIFASMQGDDSPITVLVIVERPGRYMISCNGWYENCLFAEKGIYFVEQRPKFGNNYTSEFATSFTVLKDGTDINPIEYKGNEIQVFRRGVCIGDSITQGVFNYAGGEPSGVIYKEYSYPTILKKITGIEVVNAGISGATSKTWYEASSDSSILSGRWVDNEWKWTSDIGTTRFDFSHFDFAIIHLGINDIIQRGETPIEDVVANFETYIGEIIASLEMSGNARMKIFLATIIPNYAAPGDSAYEALNEKIMEIAEKTEGVYLVDLNLYSECKRGTAYDNLHLTAIGYHKMASEISAYISYIISTNLDEFKEVQFIGTDYTIE